VAELSAGAGQLQGSRPNPRAPRGPPIGKATLPGSERAAGRPQDLKGRDPFVDSHISLRVARHAARSSLFLAALTAVNRFQTGLLYRGKKRD